MIDFHCHFLPGIDDGASSIEESVMMLNLLKEQGIDTVVATPHFSPEKSDIIDFGKKRSEAFELIKNLLPPEMNVILGYEVLLSPDLINFENFDKLCIGDSKCILLEMPFFPWQQWMFDIVDSIQQNGYIPIIAHPERYATSLNMYKYSRFFKKAPPFMQFNSNSFLKRFERKVVLELINQGAMPVLGSDAHNLRSRRSHIDKTVNFINKKLGSDLLKNTISNANNLLNAKRL